MQNIFLSNGAFINSFKKIIYKTVLHEWHYQQTKLHLQIIEDLDDAIDQLCLSDELDALTLKERENLCPYFGVLWPSAEALSQFLLENLFLFEDQKILEIGCGLGLPSLLLAQKKMDILATDFHPDVKDFFQKNCELNKTECEFARYDWTSKDRPFGKFDLIIGSDILYEGSHARDVALSLKNLVHDKGTVLVADPGRGYLQNFVSYMEELGFHYKLEPKSIGKDEIYVFLFRLI